MTDIFDPYSASWVKPQPSDATSRGENDHFVKRFLGNWEIEEFQIWWNSCQRGVGDQLPNIRRFLPTTTVMGTGRSAGRSTPAICSGLQHVIMMEMWMIIWGRAQVKKSICFFKGFELRGNKGARKTIWFHSWRRPQWRRWEEVFSALLD